MAKVGGRPDWERDGGKRRDAIRTRNGKNFLSIMSRRAARFLRESPACGRVEDPSSLFPTLGSPRLCFQSSGLDPPEVACVFRIISRRSTRSQNYTDRIRGTDK